MVVGRRYHHHGGACCFAAKPTQVAAEVDQGGAAEPGVASANAAVEAKPRKKARSRRGRKGKRSSSSETRTTAVLEEEEEVEVKEKKTEEDGEEGKRKEKAAGLDLDEVMAVSPVGLGRRSRQIFDEVWRKFSRLGQMSSASSTALAEEEQAVLIRGGPMCEFTVPGAQDTTVLVVGATSRIGRIVVRKLMLRGYNVKVSYI